MPKVINKIYVVVEKGTNRVVSLVDESLVDWYKKNFPVFECVQIESTGSGTCNTKHGLISYLSFYSRDNVSYYMVEKYPDELGDINDVYNILSS